MNYAASDVHGLLGIDARSEPVYQDIYQAESRVRARRSWPVLAALDAASGASHAGSSSAFPGLRLADDWTNPASPDGALLDAGAGCVVLAVLGPKGGVGRSTCAATLAMALACDGTDVVLVDLDAQNGLMAHFSLTCETDHSGGLVQTSQHVPDWRSALCPVAVAQPDAACVGELKLLPYGRLSDGADEVLSAQARTQPNWLASGLASLGLRRRALLILDLPAQPSCITRQALATAHFTLAVMQADASALLMADRTRAMIDEACAASRGFAWPLYLINRLDHSHRLEHDVARMLRERYAGQVLGQVHDDQAVGEALAQGRTVIESAPQAQAALDFRRCAREFRAVVEKHYVARGAQGATA